MFGPRRREFREGGGGYIKRGMKRDGLIKEMGFAMRVSPLKIRTGAGRRVLLHPVVVVMALAAFLHAGALSAHAAAPKADLWPRWQAHDARSAIEIDHSAWAAFLENSSSKARTASTAWPTGP